MNINITKKKLEEPLLQIVGIVEKKQTMPILDNVFMSLNQGQLTLVGSDLETEITTTVNDVDGSDGQITVSARKLFDICRSLADDALLSLSIQDNKKMIVKAGKSRFTLQTLNGDDYPRLEELQWKHELSLSQQQLSRLLTKISFAMAQQDVRYFLNGLLFEMHSDHIISVTTDGHRLAKTKISVKTQNFQPDSGFDVIQSIIPRKAVLEIAKFLDAGSDAEVLVKINAGHVLIQSGRFCFISKLIEGRFPDYEAVIPANTEHNLVLNRSKFIEILSRAAILSNEKFRGVNWAISENLLEVTSQNPNQEQANDEMVIDYNGEELKTGFNVNYLLDALKACESEDVIIGLSNNNSSCLIHSEADADTLYIVMPIKV